MLDEFFQSAFWQDVYLSNTVQEYFVALLLLLGLLTAFYVLRVFVLGGVKKWVDSSENKFDDNVFSAIKGVQPVFYWFLALYFSVKTLQTANFINDALNVLLVVVLVWQGIRVIKVFVNYYTKHKLIEGEDRSKRTAVIALRKIVEIVLWVLAAILILDNLGVDITSLVAGLGIGGVAVALAVQNILGDLFSSFAIYFDRPFEIGDVITVGEFTGTVEKIGIKTTRLRELQGEEVVIANAELTNAKIQNFGRLKHRRVDFTFGVGYDTSNSKLQEIPKLVKKIIDDLDLAEYSRVNLVKLSESTVDFEVVYYVESSDVQDYMDTHEKLLLKLKQVLEDEEIDIPFPTRTIFMRNTSKN